MDTGGRLWGSDCAAGWSSLQEEGGGEGIGAMEGGSNNVAYNTKSVGCDFPTHLGACFSPFV